MQAVQYVDGHSAVKTSADGFTNDRVPVASKGYVGRDPKCDWGWELIKPENVSNVLQNFRGLDSPICLNQTW